MNTRASVAYGWGILCLAGGGAYYFAKRSINSDRAERAAAEEERRQHRDQMRRQALQKLEDEAETQAKRAPNAEKAGGEKDGVPAPGAGSKYEAREPYRSRRGDRFS